MTEIYVAAIGAIATILTVLISSSRNRKDMIAQLQLQQERADAKMAQAQAVTDTKLEALTEEVRKHNNFAQRMPVVEEQIKNINNRLSELEHKPA